MEKVLLGLHQGDTENSEVVKDLLVSIRERGFTLHCKRLLAVIDGTKALKNALRQVFVECIVRQRYWLHKERNLRAYLPEHVHSPLRWRLKKLMTLNSLSDAHRKLTTLREWAARLSSDANLIESLFAVVWEEMQRVKNWSAHRSHQILRWVASAILSHRTKIRRIRRVAQAEESIGALGHKPLAAKAA